MNIKESLSALGKEMDKPTIDRTRIAARAMDLMADLQTKGAIVPENVMSELDNETQAMVLLAFATQVLNCTSKKP